MKENDPTQSRVKKTRAPDSGQEDTTVRVNTMYKRKADKVQPRDDVPSDGSTPEGDPFWRDKKWDERPKGLSARDFSRLRKKATQFYVHGGHIWRRALSLGDDPTLVVDDEELQKHLIITSHHHGGHKGREATVHIVSRRYFWRGIRRKVESIIKTCPICQVHAAQRPAEIAKPTTPWYPMMKIHIDGQYLPDDDGMKFLLEARCDLTDRSTIRGSHGCSPFWLLHGWEPILPMEVKVPTWRLIDWDEVHTREDIVLARIRILERRQEDREAARQKVKEYRENLARKTTASNAFKLRKKPLSLGDLVLLYDVKNYHDLSTAAKLKPKWRGPYRIREALAETRTYILESLDGVKMAGTCHGDRIKAFVKDDQGWWASPDDAEVWGPPTEDEDEESEEEPSHDKTYQPSEAEDPSDDAYSAPVLRPRRGPRGDFQVRIPEMTSAGDSGVAVWGGGQGRQDTGSLERLGREESRQPRPNKMTTQKESGCCEQHLTTKRNSTEEIYLEEMRVVPTKW
ncbi:putative gag-pol poly protein [Ilyonectria robusta]